MFSKVSNWNYSNHGRLTKTVNGGLIVNCIFCWPSNCLLDPSNWDKILVSNSIPTAVDPLSVCGIIVTTNYSPGNDCC